jgi:16S rRNA (cytidine1402-2'-O)-methyltransferase
MNLSPNSLYIVSTPIGNLDDITLRAVNVLKKSDIILCEDTRHSIKLLNHLKIKKRLISYHKFNEKKQIEGVIEHINKGKILSLISDAGTPLLSDPGKLLLNECIKRHFKVVPIPGVSSITAAMSVSGYDDKFLFYGFLPKKEGELENVLNTLSKLNYSQIFFVPAVKINFYLKIMKKHYFDRKIMIAKEITKIHEEFFRDSIKDIRLFNPTLRGELTIVISENISKKQPVNEKKIVNKIKKYLKNYSLKDTVELILETENINKNRIYQLCLKVKNEKNN